MLCMHKAAGVFSVCKNIPVPRCWHACVWSTCTSTDDSEISRFFLTHWSSGVPAFFPSSAAATLLFFFPFFFASLSMGSCNVCRDNKLVTSLFSTLKSTQATFRFKMLPDLNCGELVMLTPLEALMNSCHSVGCLLPEVQKRCLEQQNKTREHI